MPVGLAELHDAVLEAYQANDPTPFKDFRRNEYLMTVENMGQLSDDCVGVNAASRRNMFDAGSLGCMSLVEGTRRNHHILFR